MLSCLFRKKVPTNVIVPNDNFYKHLPNEVYEALLAHNFLDLNMAENTTHVESKQTHIVKITVNFHPADVVGARDKFYGMLKGGQVIIIIQSNMDGRYQTDFFQFVNKYLFFAKFCKENSGYEHQLGFKAVTFGDEVKETTKMTQKIIITLLEKLRIFTKIKTNAELAKLDRVKTAETLASLVANRTTEEEKAKNRIKP